MKIKLIATLFAVFAIQACGPKSGSEGEGEEAADSTMVEEEASETSMEPQDNTLTDEEKAEGWMLLFDGETSDGWRGYQSEEFPAAWEVVDGMLHINGSGRGEVGAAEGGDIIYAEEKFGDFHYKVSWKISEGGNSGIFYLGQESPEFDYIWKTAPEMQVLDNVNHPDAKLGKDGNRKSGSLYDMIPADPQNANPHGEWNHAEVVVMGDDVTHIQNGDTVVQYTVGSPEFEALVVDSKWPELNDNWQNFADEGYFGLQDHGDNAWFKDIKVKRLN